ncbi:Arc family DNA-binding protein [Morganella morganii subsp. morganii]|uniref:Arc family DNA-binding protein n=1 Tax=Morganella morganii TaxID=582 RepID=UPI00066811FF|nr:Arc family DNA-binding protein [Morganella morganii]ECY5963011.1 Arc family DNA-binding protein [Salmonella enterica subsp. enterica serovar Infantis]EKW8485165.1 Arc family DNA-binding protein [Morganella morganii]ELA7677964.1 Arc family DNA-binding protein [Morganella morganii]ELO7539124.1 Arc family DNA-binding protein [Morganella morganii]MBN4020392.1 Arc family DNA-binding protein [Morganella morganii]
MSKRDPQLNIRLPSELKSRLQVIAEYNKRSVNAEAVAAIERAVIDAERAMVIDDNNQVITLNKADSAHLASLIGHVKSVNDIENLLNEVIEKLIKLKKIHGKGE